MPTIPSGLLNTSAADSSSNGTSIANAAGQALQVVCAWPVSGQYGAGSRVLYYVLVAACVFARKVEWLRKACLAAVLLVPAVAAIHGIVLASLHITGAVDMDVYGAFQFCSIGILAAPVTARMSRTYFYDPARNIIFIWTGILLAGLLSLAVELYRTVTSDCTHDDDGNPISVDASIFPYGKATCNLTCVPDNPFSPMRQNSGNDIYVIPAPDVLTFGAATLLAAACCIPAILSLVSMWNKILEINWKTRFAKGNSTERMDERVEGTNVTVGEIKIINSLIGSFLSAVEVPVFVAAVLAILIFGEKNFWSPPLQYQVEPIASVGQWAPIVGTGMALMGSLSLLLVKDPDAAKEGENMDGPMMHHCNCSRPQQHASPKPSSDIAGDAGHYKERGPARSMEPNRHIGSGQLFSTTGPSDILPVSPVKSSGFPRATNRSTVGQSRRSRLDDAGNRRRVADALLWIGEYMGNAALDRFDDSEFRRGKAVDFPEIPGEESRNPALTQIREQYNLSRDADGNATPLHRQTSRANSFVSEVSDVEGERDSRTPRLSSTQPRLQTSPLSGPQIGTSSGEPTSDTPSPSPTNGLPRQITLEVPSSRPPHKISSSPPPPVTDMASGSAITGEGAPVIIVSSHYSNSTASELT